MVTAKVRSYSAKHRSRICILPGDTKYYRECSARAAVNESLCEDSHAEHVQFATVVSTLFRT